MRIQVEQQLRSLEADAQGWGEKRHLVHPCEVGTLLTRPANMHQGCLEKDFLLLVQVCEVQLTDLLLRPAIL